MPNTIANVGKSLHSRLVAAGINPDEVQREVELILQHTTGFTAAQLHIRGDQLLDDEILTKVEAIAWQRCKRVPLQYLLKEQWFMGLRFNVRSGVLIPRGDTETLVEVALKFLEKKTSPLVVDVGTGSGAIAVALAKFREDLRAVAVDISQEALSIAAENAELNGVASRIEFVLADWTNYRRQEKFDALLSNPPYVPLSLAQTLAPEVAVHEPAQALFGSDEDGLGFFRLLGASAGEHLVDGGFMAVEVGQGQAQAVKQIFQSGPWKELAVHDDLNKIPRVVSAFRP